MNMWAVSTEWAQTMHCDIDFYSSIISNLSDMGVYNTSMTTGPEYNRDCVSDFTNNFPLDEDYIGPNINYEARTMGSPTEDEIDMFTELPRPVSYIEIEKRNWSDVIVAKVEHESENSFYAFFQFSNFVVTIYEC